MQITSRPSSFISLNTLSPISVVAEKSESTLELSQENIQNIKLTPSSSPLLKAQPLLREIDDSFGISYFADKESKLAANENLYYTEIIEELEKNKLADFDQIIQSISSTIPPENKIFYYKKYNIEKYITEMENNLSRLWGDIVNQTDGFKNSAEFKSIKFSDEKIKALLDLKKFLNATIKKLLSRFPPKQLSLILTNLTLDRLADLSADLAPTNQKPQASNKHITPDIDQAIYQTIIKRLRASLRRMKNILCHPSLQFLGKPNLPYWQMTLAASSLNQMQQLTKTAKALQTLTQYIKAPAEAQIEIDSIYKQLLIDLTKHRDSFNLQTLEELKRALDILQKYRPASSEFKQQMINCWSSLCQRASDHFHRMLINTSSAQHVISSIHHLLTAYAELNAASGTNSNIDFFKEFLACSIKKLDEHQLGQLASTLTSAPITELQNALLHALKTASLLTLYPIQQAQIEKISTCFQISFESQAKILQNHLSLPHFFTSIPSFTDYLNQIKETFKIEIPTLSQQNQGKLVRVLDGNVSDTILEEIQKKLQQKLEESHEKEPVLLMRDFHINDQYTIDAARGSIKNSAFNGKRVFNEFEAETIETKQQEMAYICGFASFLKNFCGSDKLTQATSLYFSQTPYNPIDAIFFINKMIALPGGEAVIAASSENRAMACNALSRNREKNSALIEVAFERTNITEAFMGGIRSTLLNPKESYLRWRATLEVDQHKVKVHSISCNYFLTPQDTHLPAPHSFSIEE